MSNYHLTPDQQALWANHIGTLESHGVWTRIKEKLTAGATTWQSYLSHFRNGKVPGLQRVFETRDVLKVVADELKTSPERLGDELAAVLGRRVLSVGEVLVPGFEDMAPVNALELYVPGPWSSGGNIQGDHPEDALAPWLPRENFTCYNAPLTADALSRLLREAVPGEPLLVSVAGEPRLGKSLLLKAVAAELQKVGWSVSWSPQTVPSPDILIVDDASSLAAGDRELALRFLADGGRALISCQPGQQVPLSAKFNLHITLNALTADWARDLLQNLLSVAKSRWHKNLSTSVVLDMLQGDATASNRIRQPEMLFRRLRHSRDHGSGHFGAVDLLRQAVKRIVAIAEQSGNSAGALAARGVGVRVLTRIAIGVHADESPLDEDGLRVLCREAMHEDGTPASEAVYALVAAFLSSDVVTAGPGGIRIASEAVANAALGQAPDLHRDRASALLDDLLIRPDRRDALVAFAERTERLDPILEYALTAKLPVRAHMAANLTWLLASSVSADDSRLLRDTVRFLIAWWARHLPPRRQRLENLSLDLAGIAAPVWLAVATVARRAQLAAIVVADLVRPPGWDDDLEWYLCCIGKPIPSDQQLELSLAISAPGCLEHLVGDRTLRCDVAACFSLQSDALWHWWSAIAALARGSDADSLRWRRTIAGLEPGSVLKDTMLPYVRGEPVWVDSMHWCVERNRDSASELVLDVLLNVLAYPWSDNVRGWARFWPMVSKYFELDPGAAARIARAVNEPMTLLWDAVPDGRSDRSPSSRVAAKEELSGRTEILVAMLSHGLSSSEIQTLWLAWSGLSGALPPWRSFKGRISHSLLARWAIAALGSQGYLFSDPPGFDDLQREARACVQFLLEEAEPAALEELAEARDRYGTTASFAIRRLAELVKDEAAQRARARVAGKSPVNHALLLIRDLDPGPTATLAWVALAERTENTTELEPAALLSLLPGQQQPWDVFALRLGVLAEHPDSGLLLYGQFSNIIKVFYRARALRIVGLANMLLRFWAPPLRDWALAFPAFVRLCCEVLGEQVFIDQIRRLICDGPVTSADLLTKLMSAGFASTVVSLLNDKELHDAAVDALAAKESQWPRGTQAEILAAMEPLVVDGILPNDSSDLERLSTASLRHDEDSAIVWLDGRVPKLGQAARRRWVEIGLRVVQKPAARARVLRWLAG